MQQKQIHETQTLRRCGLHAVNNLLQQNKYTRQDFENIAEEIKLETAQSHYTYFFGNYDLNVIQRALLKEKYELEWIRKNQTITEELLSDENVYGLIINKVKQISFIERLCQWEPRHWISIRKNIKSDNSFEFSYHDSLLNVPMTQKIIELIKLLQELQQNQDNYLLLVKKIQIN
ncbi:unnamed protein product [Paramecium pentaurelia]|uniref:ubiquitinyl hydrolase 1 n=1 Tax=Paramecium pentaurelia TaxID=43138 RepID=A0A8S1UBX5_9CILI|nr:unnamed protein product [Paramecium pentaurelia]